MRTTRLFFFALLLTLVPLAASAGSVRIAVGDMSFTDFEGSSIHAANGCETEGLWMCGNFDKPVMGVLHADLDEGRFSNIHGTLWWVERPNVTVDVTGGALDFNVPEGDWLGEIELADFGTFEFLNAPLAGPATSYDGEVLALWGQNHKPTSNHFPDAFGINIAATVAPIPEPSAALAFGMGTLLVMGRRRIRA